MPDFPSGDLPALPLRKIAIALHRAGNAAEAADLYRTLLAESPDDGELLFLAGTAELQCARPETAERLLSEALRHRPDHAHALVNRGSARMGLGRRAEALVDFSAALALAPDDVDARYNRASALLSLGQMEAARAEFDRVLADHPDHVGARNNRGNVLRAQHRPAEALADYEAVIAIAPDHLHARYNRAVVLNELARPDEALAACDEVLAQAPAHAEAHCCRGNILRELGRYDEALTAYDAALALAPDYADAVWDRSLVELTLGDFANGWAHFEARWRCALPKSRIWSLGKPQWGGEDMTGKTLLLHAEQGLGDTLQFCRFVPAAAKRCGRTIFRAPRALAGLLRTLEGDFLRIDEHDPLPDFDAHCPLMSLPHVLGGAIAAAPYLAPDPARVAAWTDALGPKTRPRIGLVWSGRPGLAPDRTRSAPLALLAPLLAGPYEFHCLQQEIRETDRAAAAHPALRLHTQDLRDFADTAALIAAMDVTIAVDTSVAHAAGAIGAPVWLMLPFAPDWRWQLRRADSPWYPSARLFRQKTRGDWPGLALEIAAALTARFA